MPAPFLPLLGVAAAGIVAGAAKLLGGRHASRVEAALHARFPLSDNGVIVGADGFTIERADAPAVLLLHGAGDTPVSLRYFAEALHAAGYSVTAPLLPGHGRAVREFHGVDAESLHAAARRALERLADRHPWVAVAGLSMGGALAVRLAADPVVGAKVRALVLLAPYLVPPASVSVAAWTSRAWGPLVPYVSTLDPRSIHDQVERARAVGYGVMTPAGLRALVATARAAYAELSSVRSPTLFVVSRHDNRVAEAAARRAFDRVGAEAKRLILRDIGGHILPVDHGRDAVFDAALDWLAAHGGVEAVAAGG